MYESDEPGPGRTVTYGELLRQVSQTAWVLKDMGVRKGDIVAIYLPVIPEVLISILACARIGAFHSVVFAGFSATSLHDRINDAKSKVVITADQGKRGGRVIVIKKIVDDTLDQCPDVSGVLVYKRTGTADIHMQPGRDLWWHEETRKWPSYLAPEVMNAEDPLFLLYTSGSTGKPKGILHTTAGYLLGCIVSTKYVFDVHQGDRFFCGGDVGWIIGHSYAVYGPLLLDVGTVIYEGTPSYPTFSRYWEIVDKYQVTQLYVAPTALRLLKRAGDEYINGEMRRLRVLGSVGEPIAAEVWRWCFEVVGKKRLRVVDVSGRWRNIREPDAELFRRISRRRRVPTPLLHSPASPRPSPGQSRCRFSASNQLYSTRLRARRLTAGMSTACSCLSSRGPVWLAPYMAHISAIWIHIWTLTRDTT